MTVENKRPIKTYNKCVFHGPLGNTPESREMPNGQTQVSFSIATNEVYKDKEGQWVEKVNWINCKCYGPRAEVIAKYAQKGQWLLIEGTMKNRPYTDKDGNKRYDIHIFVLDHSFTKGGKRDEGSGNTQDDAPPRVAPVIPPESDFPDDDHPFANE